MNRGLKYHLEDIEHFYFCYKKDCPVCNGATYYLQKEYGIKKVEKKCIDKNIHEFEIWKLRTNLVYPVYVLVIENFGIFKKCFKASEFVEFKGINDVIINNWLIETDVMCEVINYRFDKCVARLESTNISSPASERSDERNLLMKMFKELEKEYLNKSFLEEDIKILEKIKKNNLTAIQRVHKKLNELQDKIVEFIIPETGVPGLSSGLMHPSKNILSIPMSVLSWKNDKTSVKIVSLNNFTVYGYYATKYFIVKIVHKFDFIPVNISCFLDDNKVETELIENTTAKTIFRIPSKRGIYRVLINYYNEKIEFFFRLT